jgi:hypothetical protein
VDEDIFAATILLDEAETLLAVEELYGALAGADDLGRHAAETAATCAATAAAAGATRAAAEATAAALTAAAAAAEAITAPAAAAETVTTTKPVASEIAGGRKSVIPAAKRIETFFAETVALVAAAPASPIVTHISERTFAHRPSSIAPMAGTVNRTGHRRAESLDRSALMLRLIAHKELLCERFYREGSGAAPPRAEGGISSACAARGSSA